MDGHLPYLRCSPNNPRRVTHQKNVQTWNLALRPKNKNISKTAKKLNFVKKNQKFQKSWKCLQFSPMAIIWTLVFCKHPNFDNTNWFYKENIRLYVAMRGHFWKFKKNWGFQGAQTGASHDCEDGHPPSKIWSPMFQKMITLFPNNGPQWAPG